MNISAEDKLVFSCGGEKHPLYIPTVKILSEAYGRLGIKIKTREFPGERSLLSADRGVVDGELFRGTIDNNKYTNLIKIPIIIATGKLVVFTKNQDLKINNWNSLKPFSIATLRGLEDAKKHIIGMNVHFVTRPEQLINMLASGRIDLVILPRDIGMDLVTRLDYKDIDILDPPLQKDFFYHYLNKKHEKLVPKLTNTLKQMQEEGKFAKY